MQIKINREVLLKPLINVTGIVERRHTLPILSNLLVEAENNVIKLTATDLEMQISDMVSKDSRMMVKAGKSRFNLQTLPAADYPVMTKVAGDSIKINISQIEFKRLLKQVEFAMAQQDIRYYLNGLLLEVNENKLNLVGTDGHRLSFTSATLNQSYEKTDVILPRKTVIELIKLLEDNDEEVLIEIANGQVNFAFGEISLISKVIDGKFPDYHRVIPVGHENTFTVNRVEILTAMQRASILSNEKYRGIRMVFRRKQQLLNHNTGR